MHNDRLCGKGNACACNSEVYLDASTIAGSEHLTAAFRTMAAI
jgi:hypothetical protein